MPIIPVKSDSKFDWYNPHLYQDTRELHCTKNILFFQFEIPTEQECFDFFTKTWDDVESENTLDEAADTTATADRAEDDVTTSDKAPIFSLDEMVVNKRLEYVPNKKRLEYENEQYFIPTMLTADEGFKIPEGNERRFLEEEGLYVGERPRISLRNLNRMEQRILKENSMVHVFI